ncbi:hypothetical protein L3V79_07465 [Thiotrichales bacterium 19S9-12]|nr:hypothetical protein [Thiotrichales bacterium 19S9-11]MCF6812190.1 hypothetical protein [Thiotrichales bacterium 19S9-12]
MNEALDNLIKISNFRGFKGFVHLEKGRSSFYAEFDSQDNRDQAFSNDKNQISSKKPNFIGLNLDAKQALAEFYDTSIGQGLLKKHIREEPYKSLMAVLKAIPEDRLYSLLTNKTEESSSSLLELIFHKHDKTAITNIKNELIDKNNQENFQTLVASLAEEPTGDDNEPEAKLVSSETDYSVIDIEDTSPVKPDNDNSNLLEEHLLVNSSNGSEKSPSPSNSTDQPQNGWFEWGQSTAQACVHVFYAFYQSYSNQSEHKNEYD